VEERDGIQAVREVAAETRVGYFSFSVSVTGCFSLNVRRVSFSIRPARPLYPGPSPAPAAPPTPAPIAAPLRPRDRRWPRRCQPMTPTLAASVPTDDTPVCTNVSESRPLIGRRKSATAPAQGKCSNGPFTRPGGSTLTTLANCLDPRSPALRPRRSGSVQSHLDRVVLVMGCRAHLLVQADAMRVPAGWFMTGSGVSAADIRSSAGGGGREGRVISAVIGRGSGAGSVFFTTAGVWLQEGRGLRFAPWWLAARSNWRAPAHRLDRSPVSTGGAGYPVAPVRRRGLHRVD